MFPLLANRAEMSVSKQKREAIAALLQENPQRSDRAIAKQAKVSHHTVAKVRTEMEATRRTGQSAQSVVPIGRVGLDGKVRKVSPGKVKAEIEANGEFPHKNDGRTEASGHKARDRKPKPPAAVRDARGGFIRTPREPEASCALAEEVNRQPPDHADDSRPTSKPAGTDEGAQAVAELFDDFLVFALAESDLWDVIAPALPEELFDRIDQHIEALLA
jgi:hypothetical protein